MTKPYIEQTECMKIDYKILSGRKVIYKELLRSQKKLKITN